MQSKGEPVFLKCFTCVTVHRDTGLDILGNYDGGIPMDVDFIAPFDVDPTEMIPRSESVLPSTPKKRKVGHN